MTEIANHSCNHIAEWVNGLRSPPSCVPVLLCQSAGAFDKCLPFDANAVVPTGHRASPKGNPDAPLSAEMDK